MARAAVSREVTAIRIRKMILDDREFVLGGWLDSYRGSRDIVLCPMRLYAQTYRPWISSILGMASTLVAHGESGVLFGFIVYDSTTYVASFGGRKITLYGHVCYVYVDEPFRSRWGIARKLFEAAGIDPASRFGYACRTRSSWLLRSKIPLAEYEPYRTRHEEVTNGSQATATESDPHPRHEDLAP